MHALLSRSVRPYVCSSCRSGLRISTRGLASQVQDSATRPDVYDVVCVGGGPAGLSLLSALRASPVTSKLRTAIIETQDFEKLRGWQMKPGEYANRTVSLAPSSVSFLKRIGVWDHVDTARVQP
ncbi:putative ubiquinone biosynthesis monooxygenase, partial [Ascosphaera aggregata]